MPLHAQDSVSAEGSNIDLTVAVEQDSAAIIPQQIDTSKIKKINHKEADVNPSEWTNDSISLDDVVIVSSIKFESRKERFDYIILKRKTKKVWPYVITASERLDSLRERLDKLDNRRAKKKYTKLVQRYLEDEFKEQLKKLTKTEGQILVKLIDRQMDETTFEIIRGLRSGVRAFLYNVSAKVFTISLKEEYDPYHIEEDYYIEHILQMAFQKDELEYKEPKKDINFDEIMQKREKRDENNSVFED